MKLDYSLGKNNIESAVIKVSDHIEGKARELGHWLNFSEKELWFELAACILGSRVRYETAKECARHLEERGLLNMSTLILNPDVEREINRELSRPIYPPFNNGKGTRYVHHNSKSKYIVKSAHAVYKINHTTLKQILNTSNNEFDAREKLVETCVGIGLKQASLFLRNIHYSDNLAILDTHVIRYMEIFEMHKIHGNSLSRDEYLTAEKTLQNYAESLGKRLAVLDVAVWVVMRLIRREYSWG